MRSVRSRRANPARRAAHEGEATAAGPVKVVGGSRTRGEIVERHGRHPLGTDAPVEADHRDAKRRQGAGRARRQHGEGADQDIDPVARDPVEHRVQRAMAGDLDQHDLLARVLQCRGELFQHRGVERVGHGANAA